MGDTPNAPGWGYTGKLMAEGMNEKGRLLSFFFHGGKRFITSRNELDGTKVIPKKIEQ